MRSKIPNAWQDPALSHVRIVWPAAPFGGDPVDVLRRILDVAGLAVDAVLGVDHEPRGAFVDADVLVDTGRAVARLRAMVERPVDRLGDRRILEPQVARL